MAGKDDIFISQDKNRLVVHFPSHVNHINRIEEETRNFLNKNGLSGDIFPVCLAMREGLLNAVKHGNQSDPDKTVKYSLKLSDDILTMEIEDQGEGFDWRSIQNVHPSENSEHGRGIFIMRRYFSEFQYNRKGNKLTLTKYSPTSCVPGEKMANHLDTLAQAILQSPGHIGKTPPDDLFRVIEDLYVRNNRLALQNAELRRAQAWISGRGRPQTAGERISEQHISLFQHHPAGTITVDHEGRITEYSLAKKVAGGRLPEIGSLMYKDYAAKHKIDMHAELLACINSGTPREFPEMAYEDKTYHIRISPFPGGAIITSLDITSLKQAESKFIRLVAALDASAEEIVVFDHKGTVEFVNAAFLTSRGVSPDAVIGRKFDDSRLDIIGESFADKMQLVLRFCQPWTGSLTRKRDGGREEAIIFITPVREENGALLGHVCVSRRLIDSRPPEEDT